MSVDFDKKLKAKKILWEELHQTAREKGYESWFKWMGADRKANLGKPLIYDESEIKWREIAKKHGVLKG